MAGPMKCSAVSSPAMNANRQQNGEQSGPTGGGAPRRGKSGFAHSGVWRDRWAVNGVLVSGEGKIGENGQPEQIPTVVLYSGPWRAPNSTSKPHSSPRATSPKPSRELSAGLARGDRFQTLLGVTGSGKTMTMANVIKQHGRPTLVLSHNKTLAAQLYGEIKSFFPHNAVEYFISYYDYYQPEAYVPTTDTYIEKDASINEDIDRLRLRATSSLMERDDVIIVATVSAIYGLGDPVSYREQMVTLHERPERIERDDILRSLVRIQYSRNDVAFERGTFRVRGDTVEIYPGVRGAGRSRRDVGQRDRAHLEDQRR